MVPMAAEIRNAWLERNFADAADGFRTTAFRALQPAACDLLAAVETEGAMTINGVPRGVVWYELRQTTDRERNL